MKISREKFETLEHAILNAEIEREEAMGISVRRLYRDNDMTPMRFRWDLLWYCVDNGKLSYNDIDGLNDAHIDTALRKITCTKDTWVKHFTG